MNAPGVSATGRAEQAGGERQSQIRHFTAVARSAIAVDGSSVTSVEHTFAGNAGQVGVLGLTSVITGAAVGLVREHVDTLAATAPRARAAVAAARARLAGGPGADRTFRARSSFPRAGALDRFRSSGSTLSARSCRGIGWALALRLTALQGIRAGKPERPPTREQGHPDDPKPTQ